MTESPLVDSNFAVPVFSPGDDLIACLNKAMAFLTAVASSRWQGHSAPKFQGSQTEDLDTYDSDCDDIWMHKRFFWPYFQTMVLTSLEEKANKEQNNESVTAELERYKERVKTFEQRLNIDLSSREKMIDSQMDDMIKEKLALKEQVDSLEQNLSKQIKEKECLLQTFTVFKNESKEKENKYMENEIDLEKKIKELDNIIFKVGYQNPFYLKKAQRIKPTLYDGIVISDKHVAITVIDDEETLILEEESRSKMFEKEKDPKAIKQKISHKPIDYVKLNRLFEDFRKRFVPQQELLAEQTFWYHMSNPSSKSSDASPVKIEAPKELPKSSVDKQCLEIAKKELLLENDRLLQQIMSQDVLLTMMNSMSWNGESVNMERKRNESCDKCFNLDAELLKTQNALNDLLKSYSQLEKHCISLELSIQLNQEIFQKGESCDNQNALQILEYFENNDLKAQLQDKDTSICKLKDIIKSMREKSKEENVKYDYCEIETKNVELENSVAKFLLENERLCKEINHVKQLDLEPLALRLLQNMEAHIDYLKYTQEQANILREIVEQPKAKQPLDNELEFACKHAQQIQELLVYVRDTCPNAIKLRLKCSTSNCGSKPTGNKKNDRISRTPSRNIKNKVEAQPRKVNKKNRVVEPIRDVDVKHSVLKANSELICATCKKSMFDGVHDMCVLDFVENVNSHAKSAKKHTKNICKPTVYVFTKVGLKWKPTGRTFTIVGNSCPLTRITSANVVPPKKTTSHLVETQKPELKVYSRKPKNVKHGSNATDIPSSSSLVMTGFPDCSLLDSGTTILQGLLGSRDTNLYTIYLDDMLKTSLVCLLSKASKTKSWLWHRRLSHLNFGTLNKLAKDGLARGIPRLKFHKDHLTKDEVPDAIIKCIKNIQVCLNATVHNVRTDNGTEFVNQTLREFYENVGISHQTFVSRTPQQNGVVKRRNRALVEAACTMLIFSKAILFLWAEAINTACYTQNRSLIRLRYNKTPYELMQDKKLNLSFFHVFGALCYPTNDNVDLGKLDAKVDIGPRLHSMTPATSSSGLLPNPIPQQPFQEAVASRAVVLANSPVSISIDQDAPSISIPSTQEQEHSPNISKGFEESLKSPIFCDDPLYESLYEESTSQGSSSNVRQTHTPFKHLGRWTKDHPIANMIGDPSRSVSTRKQL
ncbi:retrovirus-related pol polyprotein from transposon TNT 1-94 [Tanacetum coccineum]